MERHSWGFQRFRSVAFCTPFPPDRSGVADYTKPLLETLCERHPLQVDVVVNADPDSYVAPDHPAINLISVRLFRWLADHGHYDTIIYSMGNSPAHHYIYDLLKEQPSIVWLHDVRLTEFYRWYYGQHLGRNLTALPEELLPWAHRYPDYENALIERDILTQHEQGIYLAGEVASHARLIVVNSGFSKELVEIESGGRVPVVALPFAAPARVRASPLISGPELASKYGLDETDTPVVSVGIIGPPKCPDAIIDGFVAADPAVNHLMLVFVGECAGGRDSAYQRELQRRISEHGIDDRVRFTGYVDEVELDSWLVVARCAIQLRFPTNGESSASVMRCLAAGVPTIVSDHGPLRELPDDAVVKMPAPVESAVLADALLRLVMDDPACEGLRHRALRYAQEVSFDAVADRFWTEVFCAP